MERPLQKSNQGDEPNKLPKAHFKFKALLKATTSRMPSPLQSNGRKILRQLTITGLESLL